MTFLWLYIGGVLGMCCELFDPIEERSVVLCRAVAWPLVLVFRILDWML